MSIALQVATEAELPAIVALMNAAFRGATGKQSWSIEAGYITGARTNEALLSEELAAGVLILLAKEEKTRVLHGCVSLHALSSDKWSLGSLTVDPGLQNNGFGRKLLCASEEYAALRGARKIEITVINVRDALITWYERRGYRRTGETRPFPYGDNRFGTPTRDDLEFFVFERDLSE